MHDFSPERLVEVLDRHGVAYLIVGGVAARAYGASRETKDIDCLVRRTRANLDRLAAAMLELHARLRVEGLSDGEAALLPIRIDALTLNAIEISTWRTDAGDLDVLVDIPGRDGKRRLLEISMPTHAQSIMRVWRCGSQGSVTSCLEGMGAQAQRP